jgi:DNA modification methylase
MFSFTGDTVLDPFAGTFSAVVAAMHARRNSIGNELDPYYFRSGVERVKREVNNFTSLFGSRAQIQLVQERTENRCS